MTGGTSIRTLLIAPTIMGTFFVRATSIASLSIVALVVVRASLWVRGARVRAVITGVTSIRTLLIAPTIMGTFFVRAISIASLSTVALVVVRASLWVRGARVRAVITGVASRRAVEALRIVLVVAKGSRAVMIRGMLR